MRFRDLKIRTKLLAVGAVAMSATVTLGLLGIRASSEATKRSDFAYRQGAIPLAQMGDVREVFNQARNLASATAAAIDDPTRQKLGADVTAKEGEVDAKLDTLAASTVGDPSFVPMVVRVKAAWKDYRGALDTLLMPAALAGDTALWWQNRDAVIAKTTEINDAIADATADLVDHSANLDKAATSAGSSTADHGPDRDDPRTGGHHRLVAGRGPYGCSPRVNGGGCPEASRRGRLDGAGGIRLS